MPKTSHRDRGGGTGGTLCAGVEVALLLVGGASLFDFAPAELGWVGVVEGLVLEVAGFPPSALLVQPLELAGLLDTHCQNVIDKIKLPWYKIIIFQPSILLNSLFMSVQIGSG